MAQEGGHVAFEKTGNKWTVPGKKLGYKDFQGADVDTRFDAKFLASITPQKACTVL